MILRVLVAGVSLSLLAGETARAEAPAPGDVDSVVECVEENAPRSSVEESVTFEAVDRIGSKSTSEAKVYWQEFPNGSRALIRFSAPPDLRGSALLLIKKEDRSDMFMYLPELRKVRRVTQRSAGGSMFGTDFTYEDFERLQKMSEDSDRRRLPDSTLDGAAVWVLESKPARGEDSEYERIVDYIDPATCVPVKVEMYEHGGKLRKVLVADRGRIEQVGEIHVPRLLTMKDLVNETHTDLRIDEIEVDEKLPRKLFSERELISGGR